jgi:hypothetical protein
MTFLSDKMSGPVEIKHFWEYARDFGPHEYRVGVDMKATRQRRSAGESSGNGTMVRFIRAAFYLVLAFK